MGDSKESVPDPPASMALSSKERLEVYKTETQRVCRCRGKTVRHITGGQWQNGATHYWRPVALSNFETYFVVGGGEKKKPLGGKSFPPKHVIISWTTTDFVSESF
jgi:hypothetical protein